MNSQWVRGNRPRVKISFWDRDAKAFVDPHFLQFKYYFESQREETVFVYGTDSELVKDEAGKYPVDVSIDTEEMADRVICRYEARDAADVAFAAAETILEAKSIYSEAN
jgi:hypothetical protein